MNREIPLSIPEISGNEWRYIKECLDTGWISSAGKFVGRFEKKISGYTSARYAVSCINGTCGLQVALRLAGVKPSDEVIVPTLTFIAPINVVRYLGAEPVFMDCDDYMNMDPLKLQDFCERECTMTKKGLKNIKSGRRIRAVVPVHVFGHPCDMMQIMKIAAKYNLRVVEDATESMGSYYKEGIYKNRHTGTVGDFGIYSFNGNKIITTGGGGMIVTDKRSLADKARYLTMQAKDDGVRYLHNEIGYNYRLSNIHAALGMSQIERLKAFIKIKRENFNFYLKNIRQIEGLKMVEEPFYAFSNYWFYSLIIDKKKYGMSNFELMKALAAKRISARPIWYLNHKQKPYIKNQSHKVSRARAFYDSVLNLPCSLGLTAGDMERVIGVIKNNAKN